MPATPNADRADGATNLVLFFLDQAARYGDAPFLWAKHGDGWQPLSWNGATSMTRSPRRGAAGSRHPPR